VVVTPRAQAATSGNNAITASFQPNADGSLRVLVGAPTFNGNSNAAMVASALLGNDATLAATESANGLQHPSHAPSYRR
jgi:hypothetical protein